MSSATKTLTPRKRAKFDEKVREETINAISEALGLKGPEHGRFSCVQDIFWVTDLPISVMITSDHFRLYTIVRGIFVWAQQKIPFNLSDVICK